jgi:hypothetical protein
MCFGISLLCVNISARQRVAVRFDKKRTTKVVYHAKICRAAFAVRFREKRTAKCLPCISGKNARQSVCCVFLVLCRAAHGKGLVSRCDATTTLHTHSRSARAQVSRQSYLYLCSSHSLTFIFLLPPT